MGNMDSESMWILKWHILQIHKHLSEMRSHESL
jgi:hypothetical protein